MENNKKIYNLCETKAKKLKEQYKNIYTPFAPYAMLLFILYQKNQWR